MRLRLSVSNYCGLPHNLEQVLCPLSINSRRRTLRWVFRRGRRTEGSSRRLRPYLVRPLAALASLSGRALALMPVLFRRQAVSSLDSPLHPCRTVVLPAVLPPCHRPDETGSNSVTQPGVRHSTRKRRTTSGPKVLTMSPELCVNDVSLTHP